MYASLGVLKLTVVRDWEESYLYIYIYKYIHVRLNLFEHMSWVKITLAFSKDAKRLNHSPSIKLEYLQD